jgi:hypothetical protein
VVIGLAWLSVLVASLVSLGQTSVPGQQIVAYLAAWLLGGTVPGVLVWRAVSGPSTFVRELGYGSVLGIALQLAMWAVATAVHRPVLLAALPAGVIVSFVAVPQLRRHLWPRRSIGTRTPARWHVVMAAVTVLSIWRLSLSWLQNVAVPPEPSSIGKDLWFHVALAHEMARTIRPQDPFIVGEALRYHWFADAHVAATAQLSGATIPNTMLALWLVPILVVLLLVVAAAAEHFMAGPLAEPAGVELSDARRWWVGPCAAFFVIFSPAVWQLTERGGPEILPPFRISSPTATLASIVVVAFAAPVLDILRRRARPGTWVILIVLLMTGAGTKPSVLPVIASGAAVVILADLLRRRGLNRSMLVVVGLAGLITVAAAPFLFGSTGGSRLQLFGLTMNDPAYRLLAPPRRVLAGGGGWLVPALADNLPWAVPVVAMLVAQRTLAEVPRLLALAGLAVRPLREDPAVVWAAGVVLGSYGAMWVLAHPAYAQVFFWSSTIPLATVVTVTNAARMLPVGRRAWRLAGPLALTSAPGLVAGALLWGREQRTWAAPSWAGIADRLLPYGVVALSLAICVGLAVALRRFDRGAAIPLLAVVTACCLAVTLPATYDTIRDRATRSPGRAPVQVNLNYVSAEQAEAALWLQENSASTAVVATNFFCLPMGQDSRRCVRNSMWLSAITGRRTVLSDWTYSEASFARYDATTRIWRMPSPRPERLQLSIRAVERPTPRVLGRLRKDYGARWIFADRRATRISPKLKRLASLRYESQNIRIYRLRDSYPS